MRLALALLVALTAMTIAPTRAIAAETSILDRAADRRAARLEERTPPAGIPLRTFRRDRNPTTAATAPMRKSRRDLRRETRLLQTQETGRRTAQLEERRQQRIRNHDGELSIWEQVILATNEERRRNGLPPLTENPILNRSAQKHAEDMLHRAFFDHRNPDGIHSGDRIKAEGYGAFTTDPACRCLYKLYMGENIARGQTSVEQVVAEWMASPKHRDAILSPNYTEIGIGVVEDVWVQHFGAMVVEELP